MGRPGSKPKPSGHRLTVGDAELRAIFDSAIAVIAAPPDLIRRLGIESVERSALRTVIERIEDSDFKSALETRRKPSSERVTDPKQEARV